MASKLEVALSLRSPFESVWIPAKGRAASPLPCATIQTASVVQGSQAFSEKNASALGKPKQKRMPQHVGKRGFRWRDSCMVSAGSSQSTSIHRFIDKRSVCVRACVCVVGISWMRSTVGPPSGHACTQTPTDRQTQTWRDRHLDGVGRIAVKPFDHPLAILPFHRSHNLCVCVCVCVCERERERERR